jgi:outer membrane protein assembly factor BamB
MCRWPLSVSPLLAFSGKLIWSRDLFKEFGATKLEHGYACHALPYKDSWFFLAGERGSAAVALKQSDGSVLWKIMDFRNAYSSPLLIEVDGQPQIVALMKFQVIGFRPDDGQLLWQPLSMG